MPVFLTTLTWPKPHMLVLTRQHCMGDPDYTNHEQPPYHRCKHQVGEIQHCQALAQEPCQQIALKLQHYSLHKEAFFLPGHSHLPRHEPYTAQKGICRVHQRQKYLIH